MSLWCDDFYVTPQRHHVIKVITNKVITSRCVKDDVDQSQNVSKSAEFRCEKMHFCSSESRESRIFGISALKTIVLKNKTKLFFDLQLVEKNIWSSRPSMWSPVTSDPWLRACPSLQKYGSQYGSAIFCNVPAFSPRSPLSGCLYRDVIWGTESLYPIQMQCNISEIYGGLAP